MSLEPAETENTRGANQALRWISSGLTPQSLVLLVSGVLGTYFAMGTRVTVVEQQAPALTRRMDDLEKRVDFQRQSIADLRETKVSVVTYEEDRRRLSDELKTIQDATGRIETALLTQPRR